MNKMFEKDRLELSNIKIERGYQDSRIQTIERELEQFKSVDLKVSC